MRISGFWHFFQIWDMPPLNPLKCHARRAALFRPGISQIRIHFTCYCNSQALRSPEYCESIKSARSWYSTSKWCSKLAWKLPPLGLAGAVSICVWDVHAACLWTKLQRRTSDQLIKSLFDEIDARWVAMLKNQINVGTYGTQPMGNP
jgi:hypothetical protein